MHHSVVSAQQISRQHQQGGQSYVRTVRTCNLSLAMATLGDIWFVPPPAPVLTILSSCSAEEEEFILSASRLLSSIKYSMTLI